MNHAPDAAAGLALLLVFLLCFFGAAIQSHRDDRREERWRRGQGPHPDSYRDPNRRR